MGRTNETRRLVVESPDAPEHLRLLAHYRSIPVTTRRAWLRTLTFDQRDALLAAALQFRLRQPEEVT